MSFKVELIEEALKDYKKLDGSIKKVINKKITELSEKPFIGEELGHKHNIDLTGFFKIYAAKKSYRIVYRLITPEEIEIIEIWGIGKREKEEIYKLIGKRILANK
jgi:mRNA interferase RelE/StbE